MMTCTSLEIQSWLRPVVQESHQWITYCIDKYCKYSSYCNSLWGPKSLAAVAFSKKSIFSMPCLLCKHKLVHNIFHKDQISKKMSNCLNLQIMFFSPKQGLARIETFFLKSQQQWTGCVREKLKPKEKKAVLAFGHLQWIIYLFSPHVTRPCCILAVTLCSRS